MARSHRPLLTEPRRKPSLFDVCMNLHMLYTTLDTTRDLRGSRLFNG